MKKNILCIVVAVFCATSCSDSNEVDTDVPQSVSETIGSPGSVAAPTVGPTPGTGPAAADSAATDSTPDVSAAAPSNATEGVAGDEGARILTKTAAKYAGIRTMTADFTMQTSNPLLRSKADSRGRLYQQRPDRIALRFTQPADAAIVGDGQFFYVYWPETSKDQATKTPASAGGAGSVDLQAQFVGDPVTRFRYTLQGQESVAGRATDVLLLIPRAQAPYRSLKVWVDREDALVRRFEFTESNGVERHINLSNVRTNVDIAAAQFRFTPPAGVRVVGQ